MARAGAGVHLALQHVDIEIQRRAFGVLLGIGRDRDVEVADRLDAGDEVGRGCVAIRMRHVARSDAGRRIAAQGHDARDAGLRIGPDHAIDIGAARPDAGQMRRRLQGRVRDHARDGAVRALARRPAGAIGHRDEFRIERCEPVDRVPQDRGALVAFRREELEGDSDTAPCPPGIAMCDHQATSSPRGSRSEMRRASRPTQIETVSRDASLPGDTRR